MKIDIQIEHNLKNIPAPKAREYMTRAAEFLDLIKDNPKSAFHLVTYTVYYAGLAIRISRATLPSSDVSLATIGTTLEELRKISEPGFKQAKNWLDSEGFLIRPQGQDFL